MRALWAISVVVLVAACGGPSTPSASMVPGSSSPISSPLASSDPAPTSIASLAPSPDPQATRTAARGWAQDPPKPLLLNSAVRVLVDELNVRAKPSTSARRIDIAKADNIIAVHGLPPVQADGFLWYFGSLASLDGELEPLPHNPRDVQDGFSGWFVALTDSTAYVEAVAPRCPSGSDIKILSGMLPAERLVCFGRTSIAFEGTYGCPVCLAEIYGEFRPRWLADPNIINFIAAVGTQGQGLGINIRFPPEGPNAPPDGTVIRVRGHFADAAAEECSISMPDPWGDSMEFDAVPAAVARLWCRQAFVVESYDVVGTDDTYDPSA